MNLPDTMRAAVLGEYKDEIELDVAEIPVPRPGPGQVLLRMLRTNINPSDLSFMHGQYGFRKPLPTVPGFEGSGLVVASGGGLLGRYLRGKRVSTAARPQGSGTFAEYMLADAGSCIPLLNSVSDEQGAALIVNPLTAWAMLNDIVLKGGAKAVVQTAAAGALGRMIQRLGTRLGLRVVNIVRRPEQVAALKQIGAGIVLDSSDAQFESTLRHVAREADATVALDAVSGEMSATLLSNMPANSRVVVYGGLSGEAVPVQTGMLIFGGQQLEGFWLSRWIAGQRGWSMIRLARRIQKMLAGDLRTEVREVVPLSEASRAVRSYQQDMSAGKMLIDCTAA